MDNDQPLTLLIDGHEASLGLGEMEPLVRAVMISLFTWRRANADDVLPGPDSFGSRKGWWGDVLPAVEGDRIGSRLWLLSRAKLVPDTVKNAREYAEEALQWLIDDGVVARMDVEVERQGLSTLALACRFYRADGTVRADIRFSDVWSFLQ